MPAATPSTTSDATTTAFGGPTQTVNPTGGVLPDMSNALNTSMLALKNLCDQEGRLLTVGVST